MAYASPPDFNAVLGAAIFNGLITAIMAIALLFVSVYMAKAGAVAFVKFVTRVTGAEQVRVGKHGLWDKDVYEEAMESLDEFRRKGGHLDSETQVEYDRWKFNKHSDRRQSAKEFEQRTHLEAEERLIREREEARVPPWKLFDQWTRHDKAEEKELRESWDRGDKEYEEEFGGRTIDQGRYSR